MASVAGATVVQDEIAVTARANTAADTGGQFSRTRILSIWALAAIPMAIVARASDPVILTVRDN